MGFLFPVLIEKLLNQIYFLRQIIFDDVPNKLMVNSKIIVNQQIAECYDFTPFYFRVFYFKIFGQ